MSGSKSWQSYNKTAKTLGEGPMGEASGSPTKKGRPPANGSPSGHRLTHKTQVAGYIGEERKGSAGCRVLKF